MTTTKEMKKISFDGGSTLYQITDEVAQTSIGTLANLSTTVKTDLVSAINEVSTGVSITVDSELSAGSVNPVQNKVITEVLETKQDVANLVTSLSSSSSDTEYPSAKAVYDAIEDAISSIPVPPAYELPTASTDTLGGVKVDGTTVLIDANGVISSAAVITVDAELSTSSENPVQNKIITGALDTKQDTIDDLVTIRANASAGAQASVDLGTISNLTTTDKSSVVSAINEINAALNNSYSISNPALTQTDGLITWTITHNLASTTVLCSLYYEGREITKNVVINSENQITVFFNSDTDAVAGDYTVVILAAGNSTNALLARLVELEARVTTLENS